MVIAESVAPAKVADDVWIVVVVTLIDRLSSVVTGTACDLGWNIEVKE